LRAWQRRPLPVLGARVAGSAVAAIGLLSAVLVISALSAGYVQVVQLRPPFAIDRRERLQRAARPRCLLATGRREWSAPAFVDTLI
jgi:hypothetical protein